MFIFELPLEIKLSRGVLLTDLLRLDFCVCPNPPCQLFLVFLFVFFVLFVCLFNDHKRDVVVRLVDIGANILS